MKLQDLEANDLDLLAEGLHRLRQVKMEAHATIVKVPGHESFRLEDFGVNRIDDLLARIDGAYNEADADDASR